MEFVSPGALILFTCHPFLLLLLLDCETCLFAYKDLLFSCFYHLSGDGGDFTLGSISIPCVKCKEQPRVNRGGAEETYLNRINTKTANPSEMRLSR